MVRRYRGKHLKPRPKKRGPVVVGTATAMWFSAPVSEALAHSRRHFVRRGETLTSIARRYGTSIDALVAANGLGDPDRVLAGQRLRIASRAGVSSSHRVRPGETLSSISSAYGISVASLAQANRLRDPNFILAGSALRIPGGGGTAVSADAGGIESSLERHARLHGLDPALVKAVGWHESAWRQKAISSKGAIGVMQVMPGTARYVNRVLGAGRLRVRRADDNVHLGVMYLRHVLGTMRSERRALAAYYSGPGAVKRRLNAGQRAYVRRVVALRRRFSS